MPRYIQSPSFDTQKRALSITSRNVKHSLLVFILSGFLLTVVSILLIILVIPESGSSVMDINLNDFYLVHFLSELYGISSILFICLAMAAVFLLGSLLILLVTMLIQSRNYFKTYKFERQERKYVFAGLMYIAYTITTIAGFVPIIYLNTSLFLMSNFFLFLALLFTYNIFKTYYRNMRFFKNSPVLPLIGGVINMLSWVIAYVTILGIFGNLVGYFLIYLGFRRQSIDFKLISSESKILSMDPGTPAPLTPIPKAPRIYNRTMVDETPTEAPPPLADTPNTVSEEASPLQAPPPSLEVPKVSEESPPLQAPPPINEAPSSLTETPLTFTAPKPLDINQKLCPSCGTVLHITDKLCIRCGADLSSPPVK